MLSSKVTDEGAGLGQFSLRRHLIRFASLTTFRPFCLLRLPSLLWFAFGGYPTRPEICHRHISFSGSPHTVGNHPSRGRLWCGADYRRLPLKGKPFRAAHIQEFLLLKQLIHTCAGTCAKLRGLPFGRPRSFSVLCGFPDGLWKNYSSTSPTIAM